MKLIELLATYYVLWRGISAIWDDIPRLWLRRRMRRKGHTVEPAEAHNTATHIAAQEDVPARTVMHMTPDRLRSMQAQRDNRKAN